MILLRNNFIQKTKLMFFLKNDIIFQSLNDWYIWIVSFNRIMKIFFTNVLSVFFVIAINTCTTQKSYGQFSNGTSVFSTDTIHEVRLFFSQQHYWDTLVNRYEKSHDVNTNEIQDDAEPLIASVLIDGIKMDSVGVKLKSNLSYSIPSNKKPIKIYFNSFVKGRMFDGLYRLNLSNEFPDPSMLRNTVAYKIYRDAGIMAPRTSFARVYVNNKYKGLYVLIEQVDKAFFSNYFNKSGGELIKALAGYLYWFAEDTMSFRYNYEIKAKDTPESWTRLIAFAKKINTTTANDFYDSLKTIFDLDSYISVFAADIVFNNWDSYFYGQNYYIFRDSSENRYYFLPWDYNVSLNNYDVSGSDYSILPGGNNDDIFQLPLPSKVINNHVLKKKYLQEVFRFNQYMSLDSLEKFIRKNHALIAPALKTDSGKAMTFEQFKKSLNHRISISEIDFEGLLSFIKYRHEQVSKMLKDEGVDFNKEIK